MRPPARTLALATLALVTACASAGAPRNATPGAAPYRAASPSFRPVEGDPGRETWSVRANFFEVVAFLDSLAASSPAACSLRLSLRFAGASEGRVLIDSEGTVLLARNVGAGVECVGWRSLVDALDGIATAMPQRMWAREILQDGVSLEIRGLIRGSEAEVASFVSALSALDPIREARIASLRPAEGDGTPLIEYRLDLRVRDGI